MIALVAHDAHKSDLSAWAVAYRESLGKHELVATEATAVLLHEQAGLSVRPVRPGPLGGDQQIGALIAAGDVTGLVFFWDALDTHPHIADVYALLRLATLSGIPVAMNLASAEAMVRSLLSPIAPVLP